MKHFVFFSLPGHGHTNPTVSVAKELIARGHQVTYYSLEEFRPAIQAAGATYREYPGKFEGDTRVAANVGLFSKVVMDATEVLTPLLIKELKNDKVDCIAYDTIALWGKTVARNLGVPAIAMFTTIAFNDHVFRKNLKIYFITIYEAVRTKQALMKAYYKYLRLARKYKFKPQKVDSFITNKESINVVFATKYFQPAAQTFNKTFHFVGPAISARKEKTEIMKHLNPKKKQIYISVGTIFNDNLDFYKRCIEAFGNTDYQVFMSIGHRFSLKDLPKLPSNIIAQNHMPQLAILEKATLFITHAGMNSISESAYYGVPMVLVPQMNEQEINARRIKELGAGIYLKKEKVTQESLLEAAEKVMRERTYKQNILKMQKALRQAGGAKEAASLLEKAIN